MTAPPTFAQQKGITIAPIPFAAVSLLCSSYVIWYLLRKERMRLERLYHRLVLAMNVALVLYALVKIWAPFAVPAGTPDFFGASGTITTCTVSGFLYTVTSITVPIYYACLSLQAFVGIRNNFMEEKYRSIEKWIHMAAWIIPCVLASVPAATDNYNPSGSQCFMTKAPRGCEADPLVPCERGQDIKNFEFIVMLGLFFIYYVFPPTVITIMYCWIKRVGKKVEGSEGMQKVRAAVRKEMLQSIAKQITLYLVSFWLTWVFILAYSTHLVMSRGEMLYNLLIFAQCVHSSQGFVFACVYFTLERLGKPKIKAVPSSNSRPPIRHQLTVSQIRLNASTKSVTGSREQQSARGRETLVFNIFDGQPDPDSPWAKYIDGEYGDCSDEEEDAPINGDE